MAKGYEVLINGATIHHSLGVAVDAAGNETEVTESQIHMAGDVIPEEDLATHVKETYADKDDPQHDHVRSLLKKTSGAKKSDDGGGTPATTLETLRVEDLDALGQNVPDYPNDAVKAEKVAFLEKAGVEPS